MSKSEKKDKPLEQEAVYTTIVGGRPPGSGTSVGEIPRGIEVLVKKASVDPEFRKNLMERRADAARDIDLDLDPAETAMLAGIPADQLDAIIDRTEVKPESRRVFLGKVASLMLAAIGVAITGCSRVPDSYGIQPDYPGGGDDPHEPSLGLQPDRPRDEDNESPKSRGTRINQKRRRKDKRRS